MFVFYLIFYVEIVVWCVVAVGWLNALLPEYTRLPVGFFLARLNNGPGNEVNLTLRIGCLVDQNIIRAKKQKTETRLISFCFVSFKNVYRILGRY